MLSVKNISKKYKKQQVLNNVSFDAEPGECIGLIGPNGCGKSTLLQIICQMLKPDSGSVEYTCSSRTDSGAVGYVAQNNPLYPDMTARDHLKLWYSNTPYSLEEDLKTGFLSQLSIENYLDKKVKNMSGGMQKRLSIACALASRPSLLLLDEPDAALDLVCKEDIRKYICEFTANNGTVLLATHDESDFEICSRLIIFNEGTIKILPGTTPVKEIISHIK